MTTPRIWHYRWTIDLSAQLVSWSNPMGDSNINNLKLAVHYACIFLVAPRSNALSMISVVCNNFATVSWLHRVLISQQHTSANLLRTTYSSYTTNTSPDA